MYNFLIKSSYFLVFTLLFSSLSFGQGWEREYPFNIHPSSPTKPFHTFGAITNTNNGDYIAAGNNLFLSTTPKNISLQRIAPNGNPVWGKSYFVSNDNVPPFFSYAWHTKKIIKTTDNNYLILVSKFTYQNANPFTSTEVLKVNEQGDSLWHYSYSDNIKAKDTPINIIETNDGGYLIVGSHDDYFNGDTTLRERGAALIKLDAQGQQEWKSVYALKANVHSDTSTSYPLTTGVDVLKLASGNFLLVTKQQTVGPLVLPLEDTSVIFRIDAQGQQLQTQIYPNHSFSNISPTDHQSFWLIDSYNSHTYLSKLDTTGTILSTSSALDSISNIKHIVDMQWNNNKELIVLDNYAPINFSVFLKTAITKLDTLGNIIWEKKDSNTDYKLYGLIPTTTGGAVAAGFRKTQGTNQPTIILPFVIKLDSSGLSKTNLIHGYVAKDSTLNCTVDSSELRLQNWLIKMTINGQTYYTTTNQEGYYEFLTDSGSYTIDILPPSSYWTPCIAQINGTFLHPKDTVVIDFPIQTQLDCPLLDVDLSTPFLRRCFSNTYTVAYCNKGTDVAYSPYIEVTLDPYLIIDSTSIPYTNQVGNTYTFPINDVGINQCGQFYIYTTVDCDSTVLGQTHCSEAHIFPDTNCVIPSAWDGSDIQVLSNCTGDSIYFTISNIGSGAMANARNYWIAEDHIMMLMNSYNLGVGQSIQIVLPATGKTYRLEVEQDLNHPTRSLAAASIERCGNSPFSLGMITQYAEDDQSPFVAIDCQENIGSWDPNDKQAFPKGHSSSHFIEQNQDLEYKIRFQNTGTDTAFSVVILDTISSLLDISTINIGTSSHPYTWELQEHNIVKFTFANIMLPDSNVNEPASHGFIKFKIKQHTNNPLGSIIQNQAAIYFDFNAPVFTNTTFHTVGKDFIILSIAKPIRYQSAIEVKVYPNPIQNQATLEVLGGDYEELKLVMYDITGRAVQEVVSTEKNRVQIHRGNLVQGIYIYKLEGDGQAIQSGRIIVK